MIIKIKKNIIYRTKIEIRKYHDLDRGFFL